MKHWLRLALCAGALAALLTCGASAAEMDYTTNVNGTVTYDSVSGKYTASYNQTIDGQQYALLVVKGTYENGAADYSISEDTIMYIDQMAAGSTGVSFNFIPRSTPDCVVLLGGVFEGGVESPVVLGTLIGQGVTVSGSVSVSNAAKATTIELYTPGTTISPVYSVTVPAATTGGSTTRTFSLDGVAEASYDLKITQEGHTAYWVTGVPVGSEPVVLPNTLTLPCGDLTDDGRINVDDLGVLISSRNYNTSAEAADTPNSDLNGDGGVNIDDLGILISSRNYNMGEIIVQYGA